MFKTLAIAILVMVQFVQGGIYEQYEAAGYEPEDIGAYAAIGNEVPTEPHVVHGHVPVYAPEEAYDYHVSR